MLRTNRLISLTLVSPSLFTRSLSSQIPKPLTHSLPYSLSYSLSPKFCKDCKFYIANNGDCSLFSDEDLVTGVKTYEYASTVRLNDKKCGKEAVYFQENKYKFLTVPYYFLINNWTIAVFSGFTASYMVFLFMLASKH